ncbi:MAG: hypothetical protein MUO27_12020 [Sedimentisphaerales bacterium]|nr:hypothetical protein [Sedimentisphaerales bacterium]
MARWQSQENPLPFLFLVGLAGWFVPGGGYLLQKETVRALIIFVTIALTFFLGLYIGSIGVIDPIGARPWYFAQIMNSPLVAIIGHFTARGGYPAYARPNEMGQIYTSTAGLLNLLCIVNSVYLAYLRKTKSTRLGEGPT